MTKLTLICRFALLVITFAPFAGCVVGVPPGSSGECYSNDDCTAADDLPQEDVGHDALDSEVHPTDARDEEDNVINPDAVVDRDIIMTEQDMGMEEDLGPPEDVATSADTSQVDLGLEGDADDDADISDTAPPDMGVDAACAPQIETCNGLDDDCDDQIDEGENDDPLVEPCYSGSAGTDGVGLCMAGLRHCVNGEFGECEGDVLPAMELCGDGLDNDCDARADEECCDPQQEICDGGDNDCDGEVDEGLLNACGECGPLPAEVCNGLDDNCDGQVDENEVVVEEGGLHYGSCFPRIVQDEARGIWWDRTQNARAFQATALQRCEDRGGRLPTVAELRAVFTIGCAKTQPGGMCQLDDSADPADDILAQCECGLMGGGTICYWVSNDIWGGPPCDYQWSSACNPNSGCVALHTAWARVNFQTSNLEYPYHCVFDFRPECRQDAECGAGRVCRQSICTPE